MGLDPEGYGNPDFCWISIHEPLIWSFAGPVILVVVVSGLHLRPPRCAMAGIRARPRSRCGSVRGGVPGDSLQPCRAPSQLLSSAPLVQRWEVSGQELGCLFLRTSFSSYQSLPGCLPQASSVSKDLSVSDLPIVCVFLPGSASPCMAQSLSVPVALFLSLSLSLSAPPLLHMSGRGSR